MLALSFWQAGLLSSLCLAYAADITTVPCQILGPAFPKPSTLSSDEAFQAGLKAFDAAIDQTLANESSFTYGPQPFNQSTFSIGIFNTFEEGLLHQYHYTAPSVKESGAGVHEADADSVYRLASISKLLTVYTFLIREGFTRFNDPVIRYVPELADVANHSSSAGGKLANWDDITLGDLASHTAGIARDCNGPPIAERLLHPPNYRTELTGVPDAMNDFYSQPPLEIPGVPPLSPEQRPICDYYPNETSYISCSLQEYLKKFPTVPVVFQPGHTPVYSNAGFGILGLALERITGEPMASIFNQAVSHPLGLNATSYTVPNTTQNSVIPGTTSDTLWSVDLGAIDPASNYFSSTNDLAKIGKAILNSTLLSAANTRRWFKPRTFTTDTHWVAVGDAWEIFRVRRDNGRVYDIYTKSGDWGAYHSSFALIPDYGLGVSVLTANADLEAPGLQAYLADIVGATILPAVEQAALDEASARFVGRYTTSQLNTSVTIVTDDKPGLRVSEFVSNGTDQLAAMSGGPPAYTDLRLYPNDLYADGTHVGFTGVANTEPVPVDNGVFSLSCTSWVAVDAPTWGSIGMANFVFEMDPRTGQAIQAQPQAYRVTLDKS